MLEIGRSRRLSCLETTDAQLSRRIDDGAGNGLGRCKGVNDRERVTRVCFLGPDGVFLAFFRRYFKLI